MKPTILLIENFEHDRNLAANPFDLRGFIVMAALGGPSGIDRAGSLLPDQSLINIQLPGMDVHAVYRAQCCIETLCATPIIAVTSYAMHGDRAKAIAAGFDGYIEKPMSAATLAADIASQRTAAGLHA